MVLALAEKTGWTERYLIWELPMARALEYYHAALWNVGAWTVRHEKTAQQAVKELLSYVDELQEEE
jgi:hypothetical protein